MFSFWIIKERRVHPGFGGYGDEYAGDHGPLIPYLDNDIS